MKVMAAAIAQKATAELRAQVEAGNVVNNQLLGRHINSVYRKPEFQGWIKTQSESVQADVRSNDPNVHFKVIDSFESQQDYNTAIFGRYENASETVKSKEFVEWFEKKDKTIQALFWSPNPTDGILVLDAYSRDIGKAEAGEHDKKLSDKKKVVDDIHKGTIRAKKVTTPGSPQIDMNDEQAGFDSFKEDD